MEQFSLEKWLENPSRKVVTKDGRPVRIVCWDSPNKTFPIVGFVDNEEEIFVWDRFGYCRKGHIEAENDLFFADEEEEEELTELEKALARFAWRGINVNDLTKEAKKILHKDSKHLLDLARKELQPEFDKEMDKMLAETDKVVYQKGKQDALKSLPRWKKITEKEQQYLAYGFLSWDNYYLSIDELKQKLPKEE